MSNSNTVKRAWVCRGFLNPEVYPEIIYAQTFISSTSYLFAGEQVEVRTCKKEFVGQGLTHCWIDIFGNDGNEHKEDISLAEYNTLLAATPYPPVITNTQEMFALYNNANIKISVLHVDMNFYFAKIEFPDEESAKSFVCPFPDWEEVTGNPCYQFKNYWVNTRIKGEVYYGK